MLETGVSAMEMLGVGMSVEMPEKAFAEMYGEEMDWVEMLEMSNELELLGHCSWRDGRVAEADD